MLYISTAALAEGLPSFVVNQMAAGLRREFGLREVKVIDVAQVKGKQLEDQVAQLPAVDAVYLEFGNTYALRHHLRDSGGDEIVRRALDAGAVLVGSSAGSIVLGKTVQTAFWKNWDDKTAKGSISDNWGDPAVAAGLDLCQGRSIFPHASGPYADKAWQDEQQRRYGHSDHEVVRLADGQGLLIDGKSARMIR